MKLSHLKQLVQEYDKQKGLRRELFGDALQMCILKELISEIEANSNRVNDPEITLQDYQSFATKNSYDIDLSNDYLTSNSASSHVFKQWKLTELTNEIKNPLDFNFSISSVDLPSITRYQLDLMQQTLEIPAITQIPFENMSLIRELYENHRENYPLQIQGLFFKNNLNINLENTIINNNSNNNEVKILDLILEQQRQFKDTARIRMAARGLAQLHRNHSIFSQLHKDTCVKIAIHCSDNSLDEKQAIKIAEESFDKPRLMPK